MAKGPGKPPRVPPPPIPLLLPPLLLLLLVLLLLRIESVPRSDEPEPWPAARAADEAPELALMSDAP